MRGVNSFKFKEMNMNHRQKLRELQNQHETEIENLKLTHQKFKNQIQLKNTLEANDLHNTHNVKLAKQSMKNQAVLDNLQKSLDETKTRTKDQKLKLEQELSHQMDVLKANHETLLKSKKNQNQYIMQELDQQANIELGRLQRKVNEKKTEFVNSSTEDMSTLKESHAKKIAVNKDDYEKRRLAQSDKFQNALIKQRKAQTDQIVSEHRKNHKKLVNTQKNFQDQFQSLRQDHALKKSKLQKSHETDFQKTYKKNEYVLQNLIGKKEALINRLRQMLKAETKIEIEKNKDSFYHFRDLNPQYEINDDKNGYIITMDIPEHEASKVNLTGHNRELKITMDRNFSHKHSDIDGSNDIVKRVESYTSKIPVEYIVDAKTIDRTYADGVLKFTIDFA